MGKSAAPHKVTDPGRRRPDPAQGAPDLPRRPAITSMELGGGGRGWRTEREGGSGHDGTGCAGLPWAATTACRRVAAAAGEEAMGGFWGAAGGSPRAARWEHSGGGGVSVELRMLLTHVNMLVMQYRKLSMVLQG